MFDLSEKTTKINDNYYFKEGICIGLICIHVSCRPGLGFSWDPSGCGNPQSTAVGVSLSPTCLQSRKNNCANPVASHPKKKTTLHPPQEKLKKKKQKENPSKNPTFPKETQSLSLWEGTFGFKSAGSGRIHGMQSFRNPCLLP